MFLFFTSFVAFMFSAGDQESILIIVNLYFHCLFQLWCILQTVSFYVRRERLTLTGNNSNGYFLDTDLKKITCIVYRKQCF